jgi:hydrogenase nickel incorporation protein HypA/HybF
VHEASIVAALLDEAVRHLPAEARVRELRVAVGLLSGVSPECLSFYFEALAPERLGARARLAARLVPLRGRCARCGAGCVLHAPAWRCAACGAEALRFENGDELQLESMELDDDDPGDDRAEGPSQER